ncbi:MAG: orotidine-5'-phosphate decarboxylase [archaeon]
MKIDPHVHFRDQEQNYKETIAHGLQLAKQQGVDIVFDMPNTYHPILTSEDVEKRLSFVPKDELNRYFLYIGATKDPEQLKQAIKLVQNNKHVIGIKMFAGKSTGNLEIINENDQKAVYKILSENNYTGVLAVHCEKESHIKNIYNPEDPYTHALSRPKSAEIESLKDQINFAIETRFKGTLHICHVSCPESVELINNTKNQLKITCGITPHHLMFDDSKLQNQFGNFYKINPPLRNKQNVLELQKALKNNKIDWIETDHAPHTIGEKLYGPYPSGFPTLHIYKECIENFLPQLGISPEQIQNLTFNNIVKHFNLNIQQSSIELTEKEKIARARVCLPLDGLNTVEEVKQRVEELSPVVGLFKIGKESFTRFGPEIINIIKNYNAEVFLDLKYHDIPNTVKGAANAAAQLGVFMFNIHASGGLEMMKAAVEGVNQACESNNLRKPKIIGVTILTSIDKEIMNNDLKISGEIEDQVLNLALLSKKAGLNGIVCSAADLYAVKNKLPNDFMFVTPGIKGPNTPAGADQKRVFTPGNAVQDGSTILVIGRAITSPPTKQERIQAGLEVLRDIAQYI